MIRSGFEPETHSLEGCCSIQLSYRTNQKSAEKRAKTRISAAKVLNICETYKFSAYKNLLIHLELGVTVLEEGVNLLGCSDTSVNVGLGCLSTHLLRSREVATLELQELVVGIGHDVGDEFQVLTLLHELDESGLVDNFLTSGIHQHATLLHLAN